MKSDKDVFEKVSALTPLILGICVTGVGAIFTDNYNTNQLKLNQILALDKLRPQLTSSKPEERAFAYSSFVVLGYEDMAIEIIRVNDDLSGRNVLNKLVATGGSQEIKNKAKETIKALNEATDFENKIQMSEKPVLIYYTAEWCGPCKMIDPVLDEIAEKYAGRLEINSVDVDINSVTPSKYGIRGIPSLTLFVNGKAINTEVGVLSKSQLSSFIESNIGN